MLVMAALIHPLIYTSPLLPKHVQQKAEIQKYRRWHCGVSVVGGKEGRGVG